MDSVTICNFALVMLGIPKIASFDDENNNARQCRMFYPALRDRVLRDHAWSFAMAACELAALDVRSPDPHFRFACGLPGDMIRCLNIDHDRPFRLFGNTILIDELPARLFYTRRVVDPRKFDATFIEALQYALAAEIGMANTRDAQLINLYRNEYEKRLAVARSLDSSENRYAFQNAPRRSRWIESRFDGGAPGLHRHCGPVRWVRGDSGIQGDAEPSEAPAEHLIEEEESGAPQLPPAPDWALHPEPTEERE